MTGFDLKFKENNLTFRSNLFYRVLHNQHSEWGMKAHDVRAVEHKQIG